MSITVDEPKTSAGTESASRTGTGTASVVRALHLLDVFTGDQPELGVSDIARRAEIPTSTVHRLLSHLVKGDLVAKDGPSYRLSDRLFELGNRVGHSRTRGLKDTAAPFLGTMTIVRPAAPTRRSSYSLFVASC